MKDELTPRKWSWPYSKMDDKELYRLNMIRNSNYDITVITSSSRKQFFFSVDHCQDVEITDGGIDDWVPISGNLPCIVVSRKGLEDGIIVTRKKYIEIFHPDETEIPNPNPRMQPNFDFE